MTKFSQTTLLIVLLATCFQIQANEVSKTDRADISKSVRSKRTQQCELNYLKNKKNFYRSLSTFSKTAVVLSGCGWTYFFYQCLNLNRHYRISMWYSKQAQIAISSAALFFFLSQWLEVEQIPLEGQITDLENELKYP